MSKGKRTEHLGVYDNSPSRRSRKYHLKRNYGITIEEFDLMMELQHNCCKICGRHQSELKRTMCVDHNHSTGKVRGLLCQNCNSLVGHCFENIDILSKAIDYIGVN